MHECLKPLNEGPPGRPQFQRWCHPHLFTDFRSVTLPVWATTSSPSLNKDIGWHHQHYPFYNWYPMTSAFTLQSSISDSGLPSFKNQKGNHIISICQICKHTPLPVPWSLPPGSNKRPGREVLPPQHHSDIAHLSAPRRLLSSVRQCFLLGLLHRFLNWFCAFHVTVFQSMLYIFYSLHKLTVWVLPHLSVLWFSKKLFFTHLTWWKWSILLCLSLNIHKRRKIIKMSTSQMIGMIIEWVNMWKAA